MQQLVSVIVPVYNQQKYVRKCLRSILEQSYRHVEVVVVDDGSTDDSRRLVKQMAATDARVRLLCKQNEGVALARRDGLMEATGALVMFVDGDDYLLPHAIANLLTPMEVHDVDMVLGSHMRRYPFWTQKRNPAAVHIRTVIANPKLFDDYYVSFFGHYILPVNIWGNLYKREVIDQAMLADDLFDRRVSHMGEDELFNLMLFPHLKSIFVTDEPVYAYRYGGVTCGYNKHLTELFDFADLRVDLLDRYGYEKGYSPLFVEYRNVLNSELMQRIQHLRQREPELKTYVEEELCRRYVVRRMKEHYKNQMTKMPTALQLIINHDVEAICQRAVLMARAQRKRYYLKRSLKTLASWT